MLDKPFKLTPPAAPDATPDAPVDEVFPAPAPTAEMREIPVGPAKPFADSTDAYRPFKVKGA